MEAPFVQTSQRSLLRKDTVKTPYGRKTDAKCLQMLFAGQRFLELRLLTSFITHLSLIDTFCAFNLHRSVEKSLLISRSLILDIRWIFRRLLCNEKFSRLDDSGSSTLSLQCSERLFSRLGALHHAVEALWTANQNQVPNCFKFFKFGKWCAVGHVGKVAPTFLDICVGSAEAILHTASFQGRAMASCPACPAALHGHKRRVGRAPTRARYRNVRSSPTWESDCHGWGKHRKSHGFFRMIKLNVLFSQSF